jgi:hypothetical protein
MNDQLLLMESSFIENRTKQASREGKFYKEGIDVCKGIQGRIISDNTAIKCRWKKYFQQILRLKVNIHHNSQDALQTDDRIQVEPPTLNEIKEAVRVHKSSKAPGKEGIPMGLLKQGDES